MSVPPESEPPKESMSAADQAAQHIDKLDSLECKYAHVCQVAQAILAGRRKGLTTCQLKSADPYISSLCYMDVWNYG